VTEKGSSSTAGRISHASKCRARVGVRGSAQESTGKIQKFVLGTAGEIAGGHRVGVT